MNSVVCQIVDLGNMVPAGAGMPWLEHFPSVSPPGYDWRPSGALALGGRQAGSWPRWGCRTSWALVLESCTSIRGARQDYENQQGRRVESGGSGEPGAV